MSPNVTDKALGAAVRRRMHQRKVTVTTLSVIIDKSPASAFRRLKGSLPFTAVELINVCDALGTDPNALTAEAIDGDDLS